METYPAGYPTYVRDGTKEKEILDGAEVYFTERDEKLRYDLVKRVFQWMLDTNENGTFEPIDPTGYMLWRPGNGIRESNKEMRQYLFTLREDTRTKCLTDEVKVLNDYIELIEPDLPADYQERREFIRDMVNPGDPWERLHKIGERYWYGVDPPEPRPISI